MPLQKFVEVRLVPDFEVPLLDLGLAVTLLAVADQGRDEVTPFLEVLGRAGLPLPPEDGLFGIALHGGGHEAKLHERADLHAEQEVEELIDVLPVVDRLAVRAFLVNAHVVVEEAVEADVTKTDVALDLGELLLPVGAQAFVGAPGTDAVLPDAAGRTFHGGPVGVDRAGSVVRGKQRDGDEEEEGEEERHGVLRREGSAPGNDYYSITSTL